MRSSTWAWTSGGQVHPGHQRRCQRGGDVGAFDHDDDEHAGRDRGDHTSGTSRPGAHHHRRAPITKSYADEIGADGYAEDASSAVRLVKEVLAA